MRKIGYILSVLLMTVVVTGCGGSSGMSKEEYEKSQKEKNKTPDVYKGYVVDAPVWGLDYKCESGEIGSTDKDGEFTCIKLPVTFKVGNVIVGAVSNLPSDKKVFPQDIVGVKRSKVEDPDVKKLASFLQSVDDDGETGEVIKIDSDIKKKLKNEKEIHLTEMDESKIESMIDKKLKDFEEAIKHLQKNLVYDKKPSDVELVLSKNKIPLGLTGKASLYGVYDMGDGVIKSVLTKGVTFQSTDENIATVDENGTITTKSEGTVDIKASYDGKTRAVSLTVSGIALKEIKIERLTLAQLTDLALGRGVHVKVNGYYSSDDLVKDVASQVIWSSKSPYFSEVYKNGYIRADGTGWATLTASLLDLSDTVEFEIKKSDFKEVKIYPRNIKVPKGRDVKATLLGIYEDDSNTTLDDTNKSLREVATWSVDDNETLVYTEDGNLTPNNYHIPTSDLMSSISNYTPIEIDEYLYYGHKFRRYRGLIAAKEGNATLSVKYKNFTDSINVEVTKPVVDQIEIYLKNGLKAGESAMATVKALYSDDYIDENFTSKVVFESLNPTIVSVNSDGNVTALKGGYATIKAIYVTDEGNVTDYEHIDVDFKPVGIEIMRDDRDETNSLNIGTSKWISIYIVNENGDKNRVYSDDIEWSIDKADIARLDVYGDGAQIKALKEGEFTITAKFKEFTATKTFKVLAPKSIEITSDKDEIPLGDSTNLSVKAIFDNGDKNRVHSDDIEWSIESGDDVASLYVSYDARLNSLKKGEVKVKAVYGELSTTKTFKVIDPILESISIEPNYATLYIGKETQFKLFANYSDGNKQEINDSVTWKMLSNIATIDQNGVAKGITEGVTRLNAKYQDKSAFTEIRVEKVKVSSIYIKNSGYYELRIGDTFKLKVIARYNDGSEKEISDNLAFSSNDESVATVDNSGKVTAKGDGWTQITVKYTGSDKTDYYNKADYIDIYVNGNISGATGSGG
jgi:hypothetical protein